MSEPSYAEVHEIEASDGEMIRAELVWVGGGDVSRITEQLRLDAARSTIHRIGRWAAETVSENLPRRPDEFEVEFGMKLGVDAGGLVAILAKANAEASFNVRMTWVKPGP